MYGVPVALARDIRTATLETDGKRPLSIREDHHAMLAVVCAERNRAGHSGSDIEELRASLPDVVFIDEVVDLVPDFLATDAVTVVHRIDENDLRERAAKYGLDDEIDALLRYLEMHGEVDDERLPKCDEF